MPQAPMPSTRPLVLLFPSVSYHWPDMTKAIIELKPCRTSFEQSSRVLMPYGVDLFAILTCRGVQTSLKSTLAAVSVQLALVDLLKALGLDANNFDQIIGVQFGEFASAYAANSLTLEQAILSAMLGSDLRKTKHPLVVKRVRLGLERVLDQSIHTYNSKTWKSGTIDVKNGPCVDADYFIKAVQETYVKFDNLIRTVPENAVIIEVGPQPTLGPTFQKKLADKVTFVSLMGCGKGVQHTLTAINQLSQFGFQLNVNNLN